MVLISSLSKVHALCVLLTLFITNKSMVVDVLLDTIKIPLELAARWNLDLLSVLLDNTLILPMDVSDVQDHAEHVARPPSALLVLPPDIVLIMQALVLLNVEMESLLDRKLVILEMLDRLDVRVAKSDLDIPVQDSLQSADQT